MVRLPARWRSSFLFKLGLAAGLVVLADALLVQHPLADAGLLFMWQPLGSDLGGFALAWLFTGVLIRPGIWRDPRAVWSALVAAAFALVLLYAPNLLAWCLFALALAISVLSARVRRGEPAWNWLQRLVVLGVASLVGPFLDFKRLPRPKRRSKAAPLRTLLARLVMPLIGGLVFLGLFAVANPLIAHFLESLALPPLSPEAVFRAVFWLMVFVLVMGALRPHWQRKLLSLPMREIGRENPGLTASISLSLIVFNLIFAVENTLDVVFLWSGAALPGKVTLAAYAHRGAYPLIGTALLAGLFVLVALRPGSGTSRRPLIRRLVVVWVAQNMLLVASSLLRTVNYVQSYALTPFRIAAMIWMVLVGVGLVLICWRMLKDRSAHWLINANVMAALAALSLVSVLDLSAIAAAWNVRHCREVGGHGVDLDLGYMDQLGGSALVPLVELEQTTIDDEFRDRVAAVRSQVLAELERQQGWRGWIWRDQRRLGEAYALMRSHPVAPPKPGPRDDRWRLEPATRSPPLD